MDAPSGKLVKHSATHPPVVGAMTQHDPLGGRRVAEQGGRVRAERFICDHRSLERGLRVVILVHQLHPVPSDHLTPVAGVRCLQTHVAINCVCF